MKNNIVADGWRRFRRAQRAVSLEDIEKKYARQLAEADPVRKQQIHKQMVEEYLQRRKIEDHNPSPATLW